MITPGIYDVTAYQGATFNLVATFSIGGTPVDLTNYSARLQIRSNYSSNTAIFSLSDDSGITLGGNEGTIAIEISANDMAQVTAGRYVYDLELDSGSEVIRLLEGTFRITPEVTR